jgi:hypothetical protein
MNWEEPEFEPINMSAEIGGYYDDFSDEAPKPEAAPPPVAPEAAARASVQGRGP